MTENVEKICGNIPTYWWCHSFFQRLEALGGHLITEKDDLMCSEDTVIEIFSECVSVGAIGDYPYIHTTSPQI
jgi:hypothetical protein